MDTDSAIVARQLRRVFGTRTAVSSLDLTVQPGEIYGLLGPNGSGKTTAIRMLTTLLPPTSGSATVAGADVARRPDLVRARIGSVSQQVGLDPLMNARELIGLQAAMHGLRDARARRNSDRLLEVLGLTAHDRRPVGKLSGGLRRRVDLAVALVHQPHVLFLDEPTTGLDPQSRRDLWQEIRARNSEGVTIMLTTQYLEEAEQTADRVGILREGRLIDEASPEELKRRIGQRRLALRFADPALAARAEAVLARTGDSVDLVSERELRVHLPAGDGSVTGRLLALATAEIEVESMTVQEPTLEDVFLRLAVAA